MRDIYAVTHTKFFNKLLRNKVKSVSEIGIVCSSMFEVIVVLVLWQSVTVFSHDFHYEIYRVFFLSLFLSADSGLVTV